MTFTCPNCNVEFDIKQVIDVDESGNTYYRNMLHCGICSYGWYVDSENDDVL
jgi:transcription elongation factor Elf1